jgi:GxxExxY protein
MSVYKHSELTEKIIAAAYAVHNQLGFGFIEKVYKNALLIELENLHFKCKAEAPMQVFYQDRLIGEFFADIILEDKVVVETKAVSKIDPAHEVQLVNYLKASDNIRWLINKFRNIRRGSKAGLLIFIYNL